MFFKNEFISGFSVCVVVKENKFTKFGPMYQGNLF